MITALPRPIIAAWNTFVRHEQARHVVPGMAPLYRDPAGRAPGRADLLPVHGGVEHRADADPVPQASRLPGRPAAADRLGADQLRVVPQRPGAQARGAAPAGPGVPADPLDPRRRRRTARPQDLRRLRPRPPRPGRGDRHPRADPRRAGPLARHPGLQRGVRAAGCAGRCRSAAPPTATACSGRCAPPGSADRPLRGTWAPAGGVPRCYSPVRPSSPSRSRSACPLCLAYSSTMWTSTQRSDTSSPHLAW